MSTAENIHGAASPLPEVAVQDLNATIIDPRDAKKWKELGLCEELTTSHPEFVQFLFTSKLVFLLAMYKNTFSQSDEPPINTDFDGHPMMKMDGTYTRWDTIQQTIDYDSSQEALIAKGQPAIGYNYVFPEGIVQKNQVHFEKLYPVGELAPEELMQVRETAKQFFETNPEIDLDQTKDCVLQVVTTKRDFCPRNWFTENVLDNGFEHVFLRLIDNEGKVYSFSLKMSPFGAGHVFQNLPFSFLRTATSHISTPDYEETRKFDERRVTSIPLTSQRKEAILEFVNTINADAIPFNYVKQNCAKMSQVILGIAGVEVDTQITFGQLLWRMLPSPTRLPAVGVVFELARKVADVVSSFFSYLESITPEPVKELGNWVMYILFFIPTKIQTVFKNTLALIFGAAENAPVEEPVPGHVENIQNNKLSHFKRLIDNVKDFFDDAMSDSYYSGLMVDWQLKQKSTRVHKYDKPRMYM